MIKVAFPHLSNYAIPIKIAVENIMKKEVINTPLITKKTIELGSKYAPDFVCSPFKYNLGNFIESLDMGANLLIQAGGGCRYGYYFPLQEAILKDLGYEFETLSLLDKGNLNIKKLFKKFKKYNPKLNIFTFTYYLLLSITMINKMDKIDDYIRKHIGFEIIDKSFDNLNNKYLNELKNVKRFRSLFKIHRKYNKLFKKIKTNKPKNPLKVGIVGELYTVMENNSNHNIEKMLAKKSIEVTRYINLTYLVFKNKQTNKKLLRFKNKYDKYGLGAGGTDSVVKTLKFIKNKYDGIIHIKAAFCTPEVNAMPILQKISKDKNIPILYFSFDTSTSDIGIKTRIEAFSDMLEMKRR